MAALPRRSESGVRKTSPARGRYRVDHSRSTEERVLSHLQTTPAGSGRAGDERHLLVVPHARSSRARPAPQTRRDAAVRRLPPHPLLGETRILKVTAWIDGAARGNPGPAGYGVYMKTDRGEVI